MSFVFRKTLFLGSFYKLRYGSCHFGKYLSVMASSLANQKCSPEQGLYCLPACLPACLFPVTVISSFKISVYCKWKRASIYVAILPSHVTGTMWSKTSEFNTNDLDKCMVLLQWIIVAGCDVNSIYVQRTIMSSWPLFLHVTKYKLKNNNTYQD